MYKIDVLLALEKTAILAACAGGLSLLVFIALSALAASAPRVTVPVTAAVGASFIFGVLGSVIGTTMGSSITPVVGTILPAALTFIGGIALFVITRKEGDVVVVSAAVTGFSLLMFAGTVIGAFERNRAVVQADILKHDIQRQQWLADTEFAINAYRNALNLPQIEFVKVTPPAKPEVAED
jgi:hypothetical protein